MSKIYNTQSLFASNISNFLLNVDPSIRKSQLKFIPFVTLSMILSESVVASDISKELKDDFSSVQLDSVIRRIKRLFTNKLFDPYSFCDKVIRYVISTYKKKHIDKRIHIVFDHMFSHDNYTVFMISMRIGKQGIPLWFRCFKGNACSDTFQISLIKDGISYVSSLFDDSFELIFLADRWFNSNDLYQHINSLGHTYVIRLKVFYKVLVSLNGEKHKVWRTTSDLTHQKDKAKYYYDIELTEDRYKVNLALSKSRGIADPWIIVTNGDPTRAIKDYGYRFGGIESLFKNQKSNGLYMENTVIASLKYFESMYTFTCFTTLFLTLFGADYSKNTKCYKNQKLITHKNIKGKVVRVMSLFNIGLTLFKRAFNSTVYIRIPFSFTLYDV